MNQFHVASDIGICSVRLTTQSMMHPQRCFRKSVGLFFLWRVPLLSAGIPQFDCYRLLFFLGVQKTPVLEILGIWILQVLE